MNRRKLRVLTFTFYVLNWKPAIEFQLFKICTATLPFSLITWLSAIILTGFRSRLLVQRGWETTTSTFTGALFAPRSLSTELNNWITLRMWTGTRGVFG
jgi:hypothetical protein